VIQSGDSGLVLYQSVNLIEHGTLDVNNYEPIVDGWPAYQVGHRLVSRFPYGTALLVTPITAAVLAISWLFGLDIPQNMHNYRPIELEKLIASFVVSLAVLLMVLVAYEMLQRRFVAIITGLLFAFATSAYSTASRALWQHGPLLLTSTAGLLFLLKGRRKPRWIAASSLPLAFGYLIRPSSLIFLGFVALLVLTSYRRQFPLFILGAVIVIVPSIIYNLAIFHSVLIPLYGTDSPLLGGIQPTFLTALAANLVSPARGILVYSPIVLLSIYGLWLRRRSRDRLVIVAIFAIIIYLLLISDISTWYAGASYGPRYMIDVLPFLFYLMIPAIGDVVSLRRFIHVPGITILAVLLFVTAGWSVFVNARGAIAWDTQWWNSQPVWINLQPSRVWDWQDPPFLRSGNSTLKDFYPQGGGHYTAPAKEGRLQPVNATSSASFSTGII